MHETLVCYLKDPKYGIDGYYLMDPTVDAEIDEVKDIKLRSWDINNFLISLGDIKYSTYDYDPTKASDSFIASPNELYDRTYIQDRVNDFVRFSNQKLVINKEFQKSLNDNIKIIDELNKMYGSQVTGKPLSKTISKNPLVVEQALYDNSEAIPLSAYINAMYKVFCALEVFPTKDQNFLYTKRVINNNIFTCQAVGNFMPEAAHEINMCDEGYKLPKDKDDGKNTTD